MNNLGPVQRQPQLEDPELAHAVSLSLKVCSSLFNCSLYCYMLILMNVIGSQTAEQEKALREQEQNIGESSSRGASKVAEVELGNLAATNGRCMSSINLLSGKKSCISRVTWFFCLEHACVFWSEKDDLTVY